MKGSFLLHMHGSLLFTVTYNFLTLSYIISTYNLRCYTDILPRFWQSQSFAVACFKNCFHLLVHLKNCLSVLFGFFFLVLFNHHLFWTMIFKKLTYYVYGSHLAVIQLFSNRSYWEFWFKYDTVHSAVSSYINGAFGSSSAI